MDINNLGLVLEEISKAIEPGKELINEDSILEFQLSAKEVISKLEEITEEGRKLRLGIVGEVKAGKSSFLNALLFNGKDILPKAPTPMTAALTRISYSEEPKARIVYYSSDDWNGIRKMAQRYNDKLNELYEKYLQDYKSSANKLNSFLAKEKTIEEFEKQSREQIPQEFRACKEVMDLAKKNNIDVDNYLGKEELIKSNGEDETEYLKLLNQYVGAEGKYTAIVKYTEIQLKNKLLEGIEVIDTPGLNDPILSRGRTTEKFLIECDAVFLLGYCGQFLGDDDMSFIISSLPNEGINKAVLIGSKMDSAILQYPSKRASFKEAYLGTKKNCEDQARDNINECSINTYNEKILTQIKKSLPPKCISSLAYSAALKMENGESLNDYENLLINNMTKKYVDFKPDIETLKGLSNIDDVRKEVFEQTKSEKDEIISERIKDIIKSQVGKFLGILEDIIIQVKQNKNDLKKHDCEELSEKLEVLKEKLDSVRVVVKNLFEQSAISSRRIIEEMVVEIGVEMGNHLDIEVIKESKTEHHTSTSGHWFWKKTEHWNETIHTNSAYVSDARQNIREYYYRCLSVVNSNFKNLLKIEELKNNIKTVVMGAFEKADKTFDENKIIIPLENTLGRITLPSIDLNLKKYDEMLDNKLSGVVSNGSVLNEDIPILKDAQDKVLAEISREIIDEIRKKGIEIDNDLITQGAMFVDDIVKQLDENMKKLETLIKDKQASLEKFEHFTKELDEAKNKILSMEVR